MSASWSARAALTERAGHPSQDPEMIQRAEKFLGEWTERYDLSKVAPGVTRQRLSGWHDALSPTLRQRVSVKPILPKRLTTIRGIRL